MGFRLALLFAFIAGACDGGQADSSAVERPADPVAATTTASSWPGVRREDGWLELRAGSSTGWLVLRRLEGSSWLRGYAYGGEGEEAGRGRTRRPLAQVLSSGVRSRFRRFWLHAQVLRDLSDGEHSPTVAGHRVSHDDLGEFLEGSGADVDGSLFHAVAAPWGEYALEVISARPGTPAAYCEAHVAFPAGAEHALIGIRGIVGGTGGSASFARCPDDAGWLEVGRTRVDLLDEDASFYTAGARRALIYPSCPSRVNARDLIRHARHPRLRLCSSSCCYEASDAFRAELTSSMARHRTLTSLIAERPDPHVFGSGPQGPRSDESPNPR